MMQVFTGNGHSNRDHVTPEYPSSVSQKRKTTSESASKTTTEDLARYESDIAKMVPLTGVSGSDDQKDFSCERFGTFRKQSLKQDLKDTPTCHDLALFIRYTSGKVKGQSDDGATQHEYVPVGLSLVQKNLKFRYKDLIINQHEAIRIEFTFVDLLEEEYSLDILATATIGLLVKSLAS